jgi:hypothetical protein
MPPKDENNEHSFANASAGSIGGGFLPDDNSEQRQRLRNLRPGLCPAALPCPRRSRGVLRGKPVRPAFLSQQEVHHG